MNEPFEQDEKDVKSDWWKSEELKRFEKSILKMASNRVKKQFDF